LFVGLCVIVLTHDNFRTNKHRMTKLGGKCIVQKSRPSSNLAVIDPRRGAQPPKMWRFAESPRQTQNVNKAMRADETSHRTQRAHSTCLQLRRWENQRRLSSSYLSICNAVQFDRSIVAGHCNH